MIWKALVCFGVFNFGCLATSKIVNNDISTDENTLSSIERPCRVFDMFCIRQYFAKHSRCKKTFGPAPSPLYKAQSTFYLPRINVTFTALNVEYTGINGIVEEFYINKKADNLLLAVEFKDFKFGSNENYFRFHRKGKEPIVNVDFLNVTYSSLVATIIIPNLKDLRLQDGEVFLYINDSKPAFVIGPRIFLSSDPQVEETFVKFIADIPTDVIEALVTDAAFFIALCFDSTIEGKSFCRGKTTI